MDGIKSHIVPDGLKAFSIVKYILTFFDDFPTKSSVKKAIKRGVIKVDGEKPQWDGVAVSGMKITVDQREEKSIKPLDYDLEVLYDDEDIAVINKPPGIEISGNKFYTIQNALLHNINPSSRKDSLQYPRPVHRLDYLTSGLLLIAKTRFALAQLGHQFERRLVCKTYTALVAGRLDGDGEINTDIDGMEATTIYRVVSNSRSIKTNWVTKVLLYPNSGRKHQLRIHLADLGYPIVGDSQYGTGPKLKGKGLFLAATGIKFTHPYTMEEKEFDIPEPSKFSAFLNSQHKNWEKHNNN